MAVLYLFSLNSLVHGNIYYQQ